MEPLKIFSAEPIQAHHTQMALDFSIGPFQCLGMIGPNGIGKSTILRYLKECCGHFFGHKKVVFMDQSALCPLGDLTGRGLFEMLQRSFPQRVGAIKALSQFTLIDKFQFRDCLDRPIRVLSGGENQILKILFAFYQDAEVLILDEPTQFLDLQKVLMVEEYLQQEISNKKYPYVLIVDHNLEFLMKSCREFLVVQNSSAGIMKTLKKTREELQHMDRLAFIKLMS